MARLPVPGEDEGVWGDVLNSFLAQAHNDDGSLKDIGVVADKYVLPDGGIPETDLADAVQTKLNAGAAEATDSSTGVIQLAGDLSGTATAPTIATGAITATKIADTTITNTQISGSAAIAQSKISGLTSDLSAKLAKAGDTMSGTLDMDGNDIDNIGNTQDILLATDVASLDGTEKLVAIHSGQQVNIPIEMAQTISDFTNSPHDHSDAANGGQISFGDLTEGTMPTGTGLIGMGNLFNAPIMTLTTAVGDTQPATIVALQSIAFGPGGSTAYDTRILRNGGARLDLEISGVNRVTVGTTGSGLVINDTGVDYDVRIEGDTDQNLLVTDASADRVGVGIAPASTAAKLHITQSSLGSEVHRIESVATNDDPSVRIYQNRAATTDATVTTLHTITIPSSTTVFAQATVVARRTGGSSGTAEDGASYVIAATFKNSAGTAVQIGTTTVMHSNESQAGWDCVFDVTAATARIRVTGATNNNVTWHLAELKLSQVSS